MGLSATKPFCWLLVALNLHRWSVILYICIRHISWPVISEYRRSNLIRSPGTKSTLARANFSSVGTAKCEPTSSICFLAVFGSFFTQLSRSSALLLPRIHPCFCNGKTLARSLGHRSSAGCTRRVLQRKWPRNVLAEQWSTSVESSALTLLPLLPSGIRLLPFVSNSGWLPSRKPRRKRKTRKWRRPRLVYCHRLFADLCWDGFNSLPHAQTFPPAPRYRSSKWRVARVDDELRSQGSCLYGLCTYEQNSCEPYTSINVMAYIYSDSPTKLRLVAVMDNQDVWCTV